MLTHEQWKGQLKAVDTAYIKHNNLSQCPTCGDYHDDEEPITCKTGDGE